MWTVRSTEAGSFWRGVGRCYRHFIRAQCWDSGGWCLSLSMNYKTKRRLMFSNCDGPRNTKSKFLLFLFFFNKICGTQLNSSIRLKLDQQVQCSCLFLRIWILISALSQSWGEEGNWSSRGRKKSVMVLASGLCPFVYTLVFFFCRVKLKHFEKFQDTTEALAGELTPFLQNQKILVVH